MFITRTNWKDHTTEPPITSEEWIRLRAMSYDFRADATLLAAVHEATKAEYDALQATDATEATDIEDWTDVVVYTDARCRLQRAELATWEKIREDSAGTKPKPVRVGTPGQVIEQELEARGWTTGDLASIMGQQFPTVNEIVQGQRRVTPKIALQLAAALGTSSEFWIALETNHCHIMDDLG